MDFQKLVNSFSTMTCVLSVEKLADGKYGKIRIEYANDAYIKSMTNRGDEGDSVFKKEFIPGSEYQHYMPKELNFENFCYQCAILKNPIHAYIRPEHYNFWINQFLLPLEIEDPCKAYCTYSIEMSFKADVNKMTALSAEVSANVLKTCIKLRGAEDLPKTMSEVVDDIREMCGANYCCILLTDFRQHSCSVFDDSVKEGSNQRSLRGRISKDFVDFARSWVDTLNGSTCLILKDENDFEVVRERNKPWYNSLKSNNVDSLVLLPLLSNREIIGFIWVTNFDVSNVLRIKETLELATFMISSEIASYLMMKQLEVLSAMDLLTTLQNRNSMNNRIMQFLSGEVPLPKSYGIVFADLNGLKTVNDNEGHEAGDQLLKDASQILKISFNDCEIYRAGGDEFMIVALGIEKSDLEERVQKIRDDSMIPGHISFAVGLYFEENGGDIRDAMRTADANMYLDKRQFYSRFPELRRR